MQVLLLDLDPSARITVAALGIAVCTVVPVILIYVPKLLVVQGILPAPEDDDLKTKNTTANNTSDESNDTMSEAYDRVAELEAEKAKLLAEMK